MRHAFFVLSAVLILMPLGLSQPAITVRVDPRVELLSTVFRLAGNPEYRQGGWEAHTEAVEAWFGPHARHPAVAMARRLRATRGISFNAVMSFAAHLKDAEASALLEVGSGADRTLERRWTDEDAAAFRAVLADFAREARFGAFWKRQAKRAERARGGLERFVGREVRLGWFSETFAEGPQRGLVVVASLLNGGANYSVSSPGSPGEIWAILGVSAEAGGAPGFGKDTVGLVIHEFCHAWANPIVDTYAARLDPAAERLWPQLEERMKRQAYGTPRILLYESLVRSLVLDYLHRYGARGEHRRQAEGDRKRGFLWVPALGESLVRAKDHGKGPLTGAVLASTFAGGLDGWAARDALAVEREGRPQVVSVTPARGAKAVPAGEAELVVRFDRSMRRSSFSFVLLPGAGGTLPFPKTRGRPRWDRDGRRIVLPVVLEAGKEYGLSLNGPNQDGFLAEDGTVLEPYRWTFRTAPR